jgi:hypothetical protein
VGCNNITTSTFVPPKQSFVSTPFVVYIWCTGCFIALYQLLKLFNLEYDESDQIKGDEIGMEYSTNETEDKTSTYEIIAENLKDKRRVRTLYLLE